MEKQLLTNVLMVNVLIVRLQSLTHWHRFSKSWF